MSASLSRLQPSEHPRSMCERWCARKQLIVRLWKTSFVMPGDAKKPCRAGRAFPRTKAKAPSSGASSNASCRSGDLRHVCGLGSFLPLHNFEFDFIPLGERLETGSTNRAEVHEYVGTTLARNKTKPFRVVEPFDRTSDACH